MTKPATPKPLIQGVPYFPGRATGRICQSPTALSGRDIALLRPDALSRLSGRPAGLIIIDPTPFSHNLIGLLGRGLPTVLIEAEQAQPLHAGMEVHLDGESGGIATGHACAQTAPPLQPPTESFTTSDGTAIHLLASVRSAGAASQAVTLGASGIGLVRSEFLLPEDDSVPDEDFYRHSLHALISAAAPLPVTVRLLDMAADKRPAWLPPSAQLGQPLGLQGVRVYSSRPVRQVVHAQLVALGELAPIQPLRVLIPFIVRLEELEHWQTLLREQLSDSTPVGAMVETLSAALDMPRLLETADFVAIGCNDLMQALFSADRDEPRLRHYLDPYAPVLFRLLRQIADSAGECLERIQLCGVLSQIQGILPVLVGLGYRRFSVDAPFIPHLANRIAGISLNACRRLATEVCSARTTPDVRERLQLPPQPHPPYLT